MKKILFFTAFLSIFLQNFVFCQNSESEKSDPKAKIILDKLKKQYDGYKTMQADFVLSVEAAEKSKPETQRGKLTQAAEKYRMELPNQLIVSDGKAVWFYQKKNNEVQISNYDPDEKDGALLSPTALMRMYENGKLLYALAGEDSENGKKVKLIEFKAKDRKADYAKLRLALDAKNNEIVSLRVFNKDGSRYTFKLDKLLTNNKLEQNVFMFDASKFPKVHVEDLRI